MLLYLPVGSWHAYPTEQNNARIVNGKHVVYNQAQTLAAKLDDECKHLGREPIELLLPVLYRTYHKFANMLQGIVQLIRCDCSRHADGSQHRVPQVVPEIATHSVGNAYYSYRFFGDCEWLIPAQCLDI